MGVSELLQKAEFFFLQYFLSKFLTPQHLEAACSGEVESDVHDGRGEDVTAGGRQKHQIIEAGQNWLRVGRDLHDCAVLA